MHSMIGTHHNTYMKIFCVKTYSTAPLLQCFSSEDGLSRLKHAGEGCFK